MVKLRKRLKTVDVVIAASGTVSAETQLEGDLVGIITDSDLVTGNLTFQSSITSGGSFLEVRDASNNTPAIVGAVASKWYSIAKGGILGMGYFKIVSASTQTSGTTITLVIEAKED